MDHGRWMNLIGFQHAVATLGVHFKEQDEEETVRVSMEYKTFCRRQGESLEEALSRFDLLHATAATMNVHESNPTNLGLKFLQAFPVPPHLYLTIMAHTDGRIPNTTAQLEQMKESLKRW
eukprot:6807365-Prorocentrum_lima.AAC.1